jgi:hypothetical protein
MSAIKHDQGKADYTLIPWDILGDPTTRDLILPLFGWWTRRTTDRDIVVGLMRHAYRARGLELVDCAMRSLNFGAQKYSAWNWYAGFPARRSYAAACRHYIAIERGEACDPESGLDHLDHLAFYALTIARVTEDDRPDIEALRAA